MIVEKDGVTYELTNKTQVTAFTDSGWTVREKPDETAKKPEKEPKK
jgi:hypothetical protein